MWFTEFFRSSHKIGLIALLFFADSDCSDHTDHHAPVHVLPADYVLPYPVGQTYRVSQGNNSRGGHSPDRFDGVFRFGYDFDMPVGSIITAARDGDVVFVLESFDDDDHEYGHENVVVIAHGDGSYARYVHIRKSGALVDPGLKIKKGDTLAYSGNSGYTLNEPHLHFDVVMPPAGTYPDIKSQSVFVNFKNSASYPAALAQGRRYCAGKYYP